jgi:hypothetical protein
MNDQTDERRRVEAIASEIRALSATKPKSDGWFSGCCHTVTPTGERICHDWDGLDEDDCRLIGIQSGSTWQFVPGQKCPK